MANHFLDTIRDVAKNIRYASSRGAIDELNKL